MEHLFFKSSQVLEEIKTKFFSALGITGVLEGDSSHYPEGIYFFCTVFGVEILLAHNNYDYDNVYNYFVSIKADILGEIKEDKEVIKLVTDILLRLLPNHYIRNCL